MCLSEEFLKIQIYLINLMKLAKLRESYERYNSWFVVGILCYW